MKVAIIGSRNIPPDMYPKLCEEVPAGCSEIISGGASGADKLAERYAAEHNIRLTVIRPDYAGLGKAAPLTRNAAIVARADFVIALWDGKSPGTKQALKACIDQGKPVKVIL